MIKISQAWKAIITAVGGVTTALTATAADEVIGLDELGQLGAAVGVLALTVYGVWRVPNQDAAATVTASRAKMLAALDETAKVGRIAGDYARTLRTTGNDSQK